MNNALETIYNFLAEGESEIQIIDISGIPRYSDKSLITDYSISENKNIVNLSGDCFGFAFFKEQDEFYKIKKYGNLLIIEITNQKLKLKLHKTGSDIKPLRNLRVVEYASKGDYFFESEVNHSFGYFHKFATRQSHEECEEFAIIEDLNGNVKMLNLSEHKIKFINSKEDK